MGNCWTDQGRRKADTADNRELPEVCQRNEVITSGFSKEQKQTKKTRKIFEQQCGEMMEKERLYMEGKLESGGSKARDEGSAS